MRRFADGNTILVLDRVIQMIKIKAQPGQTRFYWNSPHLPEINCSTAIPCYEQSEFHSVKQNRPDESREIRFKKSNEKRQEEVGKEA
jgi:hypothetical protein